MSREKLLIVDDERDMLAGLKRQLGYEMPGLDVTLCADAPEAGPEAAHLEPDVVLLDVRMPRMDGLEVLGVLKAQDPQLTCIMMTAHGTIELAVQAMKAGAYDFITKPFDLEALKRVLQKGLERNRLLRENLRLRSRVVESDFHGMLGRSAPMIAFFSRIKAVARSDYNVLIRGESGTGKELAARAIHAESPRKRRAMITVNCPAVPEHLLESELFGHRKGAFTGADRDQRGLFEEADGGTIFLDEIGDVPVSVQTKLLRVLQDGEIKPLGGARSFSVNVRIIAATNQDLEEKIADRCFREDLFYRLNGVTLKPPTLEEARDDIPQIAAHYVRQSCRELDLAPKSLEREALHFLVGRKWRGNVRELQNLVRQAVMFSTGATLSLSDFKELLPEETAHPVSDESAQGVPEPYAEAKERIVESFTRSYVDRLLRHTQGNVTRGAELSGLGRPSLQKILRRLDIEAEHYRPGRSR
jgi:DNA-binding NtrC family response regulator